MGTNGEVGWPFGFAELRQNTIPLPALGSWDGDDFIDRNRNEFTRKSHPSFKAIVK